LTGCHYPDLAVLVDEKMLVNPMYVDAIRLLILTLTGRRERHPEDEDVRRGVVDQNPYVKSAC
jgi:putative ATP-dependent endonuclease of the OLD family